MNEDNAMRAIKQFLLAFPECLRKELPLVLLVVGPAFAAVVYLSLFRYYVSGRLYRPPVFEFGLLVYLSFLITTVQRRKQIGVALTGLAFLSLYTMSFGKYLILHEPFTLFDVRSLDELLYLLPTWFLVGTAGAIGGFCYLFLRNLTSPSPKARWVAFVPLLAYTICTLLVPQAVIAVFDLASPRVKWRVDVDHWKNGPVFSLAREVPRLFHLRHFLDQPSDLTRSDVSPPSGIAAPASLELKQRRNVHVVVLESFVDPLNFANARLPFDPIDPRLRRWMDEAPSLALSPVFGGQSAQAEFEILCGVPSYGMFGVEFNVLGGARMPCLPEILGRYGYTTVGSVPLPPTFFNVRRAYASVGFERGYFAEDFAFTDMDGLWLSTVEVFRQVLQFIGPEMTRGTPIFNYIVTTSGHLDFRLNAVRRPPVLSRDSWVGRVANAVYYNSAAVADFVTTLEERDPKAIIVIVGDHLPLLGLDYQRWDYRLSHRTRAWPGFWELDWLSAIESRATVLVVRKEGRSVPLGILPHYSIPEVILDLLMDGAYCKRHGCWSRAPLLYRPLGLHPVFTTAPEFPKTVCQEGQPGNDPRCDTAQRQHALMLQAYKMLMRSGVQVSAAAAPNSANAVLGPTP